MSAKAERRIVAILVADVVGFSRLVETDEASALEAVRAARSVVVDPAVADHSGRVFKTTGDGFLAEFGSVVDAVACAAAIQQRLASDPDGVRMRIGINLGDVVVDHDDLLGDGVNIAARLEQLCPPGGVLMSGTAFDQLKGKFHLPVDFDGEHRVKNIAQSVRVYSVRIDGVRHRVKAATTRFAPRRPWLAAAALLLLLGAGVWFLQPGATDTRKPSIAVLPFDNLGGDEATGRLASGLTEDIITDLARFPEVDVVARNSTQQFGGGGVDIRKVGEVLNVAFVLEGSIQRAGDQLRLTAQLIDVATGNHVWSERWDRPAEDLFAVQSEIADQVANRIGGGTGLVQTAGREAARRKRPESLTAYELYLLGTEALEQITPADNARALELLERAVEIDPGFARAWVELAHAHALAENFGADAAAAHSAAMAAAERAVLLDPLDAEAHAVLGDRLGAAGDFVRSEAAFEKALSLSPSSAEILSFYVGWASAFGKPERGAEIVDRVIRLDPNYPAWRYAVFVYAYFMAERFEDAARVAERIPADTQDRFRMVMKAASFAAAGREKEAESTAVAALAAFPDTTVQAFVSGPGWAEHERVLLAKWMAAAGFPACAGPEVLKGLADPFPVPGCP